MKTYVAKNGTKCQKSYSVYCPLTIEENKVRFVLAEYSCLLHEVSVYPENVLCFECDCIIPAGKSINHTDKCNGLRIDSPQCLICMKYQNFDDCERRHAMPHIKILIHGLKSNFGRYASYLGDYVIMKIQGTFKCEGIIFSEVPIMLQENLGIYKFSGRPVYAKVLKDNWTITKINSVLQMPEGLGYVVSPHGETLRALYAMDPYSENPYTGIYTDLEFTAIVESHRAINEQLHREGVGMILPYKTKVALAHFLQPDLVDVKHLPENFNFKLISIDIKDNATVFKFEFKDSELELIYDVRWEPLPMFFLGGAPSYCRYQIEETVVANKDVQDNIDKVKELVMDPKITLTGQSSAVASEGVDIESAIDLTAPTQQSCRPTRSVLSPSGQVTAHCLSLKPIVKHTVDYNLHLPQPESANCWQQITSVTTQYIPSFSPRTGYIHLMHKDYTCNVLWKIISKPPLFQDQAFWVSYRPPGEVTTTLQNLVGMIWSPTKDTSELYVITPWASTKHMRPVGDLTDLGQLEIYALSSLVSETGLPSPLNIGVYCAPIDCTLYGIQAVAVAGSQPIQYTTFQADEGDVITNLDSENDIIVWMSHASIIAINSDAFVTTDIGNILLYDTNAFTIDSELTIPAGASAEITTVQNLTLAQITARDGTISVSASKKGYNKYFAEEQIFEYDINHDSSQAIRDYGKVEDNTRRLDGHYGHVSTKQMANLTSQVVFAFDSPASGFIYHDARRHLLTSGTPLARFKIVSNPATAVKLRVTQIYSSTVIPIYEALQFPGIEWDPKEAKELDVRPWRASAYSGDGPSFADDGHKSIYFQIDILAGTIGTTFEVVALVNPSTLGYHHLLGANDITVSSRSSTKKTLKPGDVYCKYEMDSGPNLGTQGVPLPSDAKPVMAEGQFMLVHSQTVESTVQLIKIPINASILGEFSYGHASRFRRMRGIINLKLIMTGPRQLNFIAHMLISNSSIAGGISNVDVDTLVTRIGFATTSLPGQAVEISVPWRSRDPWIVIDGTNDSADLGNLFIAITDVGQLSDIGTNTYTMSLYADASQVEYSLPASQEEVYGEWPGLLVTAYSST